MHDFQNKWPLIYYLFRNSDWGPKYNISWLLQILILFFINIWEYFKKVDKKTLKIFLFFISVHLKHSFPNTLYSSEVNGFSAVPFSIYLTGSNFYSTIGFSTVSISRLFFQAEDINFYYYIFYN